MLQVRKDGSIWWKQYTHYNEIIRHWSIIKLYVTPWLTKHAFLLMQCVPYILVIVNKTALIKFLHFLNICKVQESYNNLSVVCLSICLSACLFVTFIRIEWMFLSEMILSVRVTIKLEKLTFETYISQDFVLQMAGRCCELV